MIGLLSAVLPSVMEVAGRFLPEDKEKRAAAEREIEAQLTTELPNLDMTQMMPVLMGMLGLGGLRTVEKIKQVSK